MDGSTVAGSRPMVVPAWVAVDTEELLVVLLTGGGLALIGTVLGALITQVFAVRIGRETRREERRMAVKSFQRDTLIALQDSVARTMDLSRASKTAQGDERVAAQAEYDSAELHVRMLATRVRDEELRSAVGTFLEYQREMLDAERILPAETARKVTGSVRAIYGRAGHLIQTLDAIDEV